MVSYAKGTKRPAQVDAGWPHQVEIDVPWNGLGRRLADIIAWSRRTSRLRRVPDGVAQAWMPCVGRSGIVERPRPSTPSSAGR
jgi:hypothetical protein